MLKSHDGRLAVGGVLLVEQHGRVLRIRKQAVEGYQFSDLFALPGGIVRGDALKPDLDEFVRQGVISRACVEAQLDRKSLSEPQQIPMMPPVTSYTSKGATHYTLVFAFRAQSRDSGFVPTPGDRSISDAEWWDLSSWSQIAPANLVILADLFPSQVPMSAQEAVAQARERCQAWARQVGFP